MTEEDFIPKSYPKSLDSGKLTWSAPSNIALIKYWGKTSGQIPQNPSVSFTLHNCKTITTLNFQRKDNQNDFSFEVYLNDTLQENFKPKITAFFARVERYLPFLKDYHFKIETSNTFPHSSGIASSASGMSALALCLVSLERSLQDNSVFSFSQDEYFIQKASFLARLGSGSASRSIEGPIIVWGQHEKVNNSSNLFGIKYASKIHENFKNYQDTILLVDKGEKQVSSTVGHNLMHNHPYAENRFAQAHENLSTLLEIFKTGNLDDFIALVESEALTLHAMMMTSMPYFILMKANTLKIINTIWDFRNRTGSKVCFTLDAGANVHLLYPRKEKETVGQFIRNELIEFCQNGQFIEDFTGEGAVPIQITD